MKTGLIRIVTTVAILAMAVQVRAAIAEPLAGACDPSFQAPDRDRDGIPDSIEIRDGSNPDVVDNDVYEGSQFTMQLYRDVLAREGDPEGVRIWTATQRRHGRNFVTNAFLGSAEFQAGGLPQVVRLYLSAFNRIPDATGALFHACRHRAGVSLAQIAQDFVDAPEFAIVSGPVTDAQFIESLYRGILAREPDAAGMQHWMDAASAGATRGELLLGVSESAEFEQLSAPEAFVSMIYIALLRGTPDPAGLSFHVSRVEAGLSPQLIIDPFFYSPLYFARFHP